MRCVLFPLISASLARKVVAEDSRVAEVSFDAVCASARIVQRIMYFHPRDMRTCWCMHE